MSNYLNRVNPIPPSYSGVTINITNPALNIPAGNSYMYGDIRNERMGNSKVFDVYGNPIPSYQYQVSQQNSENMYTTQEVYPEINSAVNYLPAPQYNYQTIPQGVNQGVNNGVNPGAYYLPAPQYNYPALPQVEKQETSYLPSQQYIYSTMPKENTFRPEPQNNDNVLQPTNNINQEIIVPKQASELNTTPIEVKEAAANNNAASLPQNVEQNYNVNIYPQNNNSDIEKSQSNKQATENNNPYPQQNINMTNIYQSVPSDVQKIPNVYPKEYYINNNTQPKSADDIQNEYEQPVSVTAEEGAENEKKVNTDTSKEIITELDRRQAEQKNIEKNMKKTKIVSLTNEYIMSLENYLNNPNTDIRLMAAKEILTRLDEDKNRYDDAALNALLNKMLQDPNKLVRIAALSALTSELASGNDYTVQLLKQIQQNPQADPEDVLEASQILLKRTTATEVRYVPVYNQQSQEVNKQ